MIRKMGKKRIFKRRLPEECFLVLIIVSISPYKIRKMGKPYKSLQGRMRFFSVIYHCFNGLKARLVGIQFAGPKGCGGRNISECRRKKLNL